MTTGARRDALSAPLCAEYDAGAKPQADYDYSLQPAEEWMDRARAAAMLVELKGIARDDVLARKAHGRENHFSARRARSCICRPVPNA